MTQFAFVFPGQGSQAVGMLAEMAAALPVIEETFGEASAALGYDLWALTQQGPAEELNKTGRLNRRCSPPPWRCTASGNSRRQSASAAGGSQPRRIPALVCAGVIGFADAVRPG